MTKKSLAEIASGLENSLIKRMLRAINESPTLKALEAYRQSPTFQVYRASPVFSVVEAYRNSAAFKAMELVRQRVIAQPEILSIQATFADKKHPLRKIGK